MKSTVHAWLIAVSVAVLVGRHAAAHHSFAAEFDAQKPVTLRGTVMKWEMINPHGWITLAVPGTDGKTTEWMIETSNPNGLMRLGWSKRSLKFGSSATRLREAFPRERRIEYRERRDGDAADGRKVFAGSSGTPSRTP